MVIFWLALACGPSSDWPTDSAPSPTLETTNADPDGDGFVGASDCDESDAGRFVGAVESCNGIDDDCDGMIDDFEPDLGLVGGVVLYLDADGDGWGDPARPVVACPGVPDDPWVDLIPDCDDQIALRNPGMPELCNGSDDDCDDLIDDNDPDAVPDGGGHWYLDADHDGWGEIASRTICMFVDWIQVGEDCDDDDPLVNPESVWGIDADGDGSGIGDALVVGCEAPEGMAVLDAGLDCDDENPAVSPLQIELCGGGDEDCDELVDEEDPSVSLDSYFTSFEDLDGDGFGDPTVSQPFCSSAGLGWVTDASDCKPADPTLPRVETCENGDEDCDGVQGLEDADLDLDTRLDGFVDDDGDGFGDSERPAFVCENDGMGVSLQGGDCDDADPLIHGATIWRVDADGDGYGGPEVASVGCVAPEGASNLVDVDCDDEDPAVVPGGRRRLTVASPNGCDPLAGWTPAVADSTWTEASPFGAQTTVSPDLDGDGRDELWVSGDGAWVVDPLTGPRIVVEGSDPGSEYLDGSWAFADWDGDGAWDGAVGDSTNDAVHNNAGVVWVHHDIRRALDVPVAYAAASTLVAGEAASSALGLDINEGDVTGDGLVDLVLSQHGHNSRSVLVWPGPIPPLLTADAAELIHLTPGNGGKDFIADQSSPGDATGDGVDDLAVLDYFSPYRAILLAGPLATGPTDDFAWSIIEDDYYATAPVRARVGDTSGDGLADWMVALPYEAIFPITAPTLVEDADELTDRMDSDGESCTLATPVGDVDGDGFGDVVLGCLSTARLYFGPLTGALAFPDAAVVIEDLDKGVRRAGDFDGDGLADLASPYQNTVSLFLSPL